MLEEKSNYMGHDGFIWFVGVVEDRNDPERVGRVRVRCLGHHTDDLNEIATDDLPWAHVMHPVTDPSMHGLGHTPSFLVEGSWVVGFFRDADEKQQPVILGSLPGSPALSADCKKGFNDPRSPFSTQDEYTGKPVYGPYPVGAVIDDEGNENTMSSGHVTGEPDTNRLARGQSSETHNSLVNRRKDKVTKIPIATKPHLPTVELNSTAETRSTWDELDPKSILSTADPYVSAQYPFNHVHESESGHIKEIDDTPGGERVFTQHKSGTFEEIHPKGDKMVKVVGDNYEIIAGFSNVLVKGNVNMTVEGDMRQLVKGDYVLEVEKDYTLKVGQNQRTKIGYKDAGGNREEEIKGNISTNVNSDHFTRIGGWKKCTVGTHNVLIVNDYSKMSIGKKLSIASLGSDVNITAKNNMTITTLSGISSFKSGNKLNIKSADQMVIQTESTLTSNSSSTWTHTSGGDISITGGPNIKLNPS